MNEFKSRALKTKYDYYTNNDLSIYDIIARKTNYLNFRTKKTLAFLMFNQLKSKLIDKKEDDDGYCFQINLDNDGLIKLLVGTPARKQCTQNLLSKWPTNFSTPYNHRADIIIFVDASDYRNIEEFDEYITRQFCEMFVEHFIYDVILTIGDHGYKVYSINENTDTIFNTVSDPWITTYLVNKLSIGNRIKDIFRDNYNLDMKIKDNEMYIGLSGEFPFEPLQVKRNA